MLSRLGRTSSRRFHKGTRLLSSATAEDDGAIFKGKVKDYNSRTGYGFIRLNDSEEEVFVHRNDLVSSHPLEDLPFKWPYLRRTEMVAFQIVSEPDRKTRVAKKVTFADQSPIPAVRYKYIATNKDRNTQRLGNKVRAVLADESLSPEGKMQRIEEYWRTVEEKEALDLALMEKLGLKPGYYMGKQARKAQPETDSEQGDDPTTTS